MTQPAQFPSQVGSQVHKPKDALTCIPPAEPDNCCRVKTPHCTISIVAQYRYAVMQDCVRLRNALKCISEATFTIMISKIATAALCTVPVISTPDLCQKQCISDEHHPIWHMRGHLESHEASIQLQQAKPAA